MVPTIIWYFPMFGDGENRSWLRRRERKDFPLQWRFEEYGDTRLHGSEVMGDGEVSSVANRIVLFS